MVENSINSDSDEKSISHSPKQEFYDESSSSLEDRRNSPLTKKLINTSDCSQNIEESEKTQEKEDKSIKVEDAYSDEEKSTDSSDKENMHQKATNFVSYFLAATYISSMVAIYLGGLFLELFPKQLLFRLTTIL